MIARVDNICCLRAEDPEEGRRRIIYAAATHYYCYLQIALKHAGLYEPATASIFAPNHCWHLGAPDLFHEALYMEGAGSDLYDLRIVASIKVAKCH